MASILGQPQRFSRRSSAQFKQVNKASFPETTTDRFCTSIYVNFHFLDMKVFVFTVLLALASAAPKGRDDLSKLEEETQYAPQPFAYNYNIADEIGAVRAAHVEEGDGDGKVRGSYSYVRPDGVLQTVRYIADEHGFQPEILEEAAPGFEVANPSGTSKFTVQLPHTEEFGVELSADEYEQYREAARLRQLEEQSQKENQS
ncbi:uncharacterized protein LOC125026243 [Penaeus chinensis]|uniref:uncharacterized protein LOC125026243 n=1 Tax=Penaeus chinensis TaxID=139456 RepID=UPI001FB74B54|nr:uncharacterized protein LOC125026243 [Penaeus chinensis]